MLALFGVAQAGWNDDTNDCGYTKDINDQIVRELGKSSNNQTKLTVFQFKGQQFLYRSSISFFDSRT